MVKTGWCLLGVLAACCWVPQSDGAPQEPSLLAEKGPLVPVEHTFPALKFLPPGSILLNVSLPQYEARKKTSLITSTRMQVVSETEVSGEKVSVVTYRPDGSEQARLFTLKASFFFNTSSLVSDQRTEVEDENFRAEGTGLRFQTEQKKGFLKGPVTSFIRIKSLKQDMNL